METHVKVLGILHIVLSAFGLFAALVILLITGGAAGIVGATASDADAVLALPIIGIAGTALAVFLLCLSLPGFVAGIGLLRFRPWGRILGIVVSILDLIHIPFGTALGVYGLWVLFSSETERLFATRSTI